MTNYATELADLVTYPHWYLLTTRVSFLYLFVVMYDDNL